MRPPECAMTRFGTGSGAAGDGPEGMRTTVPTLAGTGDDSVAAAPGVAPGACSVVFHVDESPSLTTPMAPGERAPAMSLLLW